MTEHLLEFLSLKGGCTGSNEGYKCTTSKFEKNYRADKTGSFYLLGSGSGPGHISKGPQYEAKYQQYVAKLVYAM